jgi:hypothetical protein
MWQMVSGLEAIGMTCLLIPAAVGLSRRVTAEQRKSEESNPLNLEKMFMQGDAEVKSENRHPFSPEELAKKMTEATIHADS